MVHRYYTPILAEIRVNNNWGGAFQHAFILGISPDAFKNELEKEKGM